MFPAPRHRASMGRARGRSRGASASPTRCDAGHDRARAFPSALGLQNRAAALDEAATPLLADELVLLDDHLAPREDDGGLALDLAALVWVVVHAHVMRLRRDRGCRPRVPDDDVGIAAHS